MGKRTCLIQNYVLLFIIGAIIFGNSQNQTNRTTNGTTLPPPFDIASYLSQFGYLARKTSVTQPGDSVNNVALATNRFQQIFGLTNNGELEGYPPVDIMKLPRCGNSDSHLLRRINKTMPTLQSSGATSTSGYQSANYVLADPPGWEQAELRYRIDMETVPDQLRNSAVKIIKDAMEQWANASGLRITPVDDFDTASEPEIKVKWARRDHGDGQPFDGPGGVLGHAFFPNSDRKGEVHFDADENWKDVPARGAVSLAHVGIHELGHTLGMEHSADNQAVMYPYFPAFAMTRAAILGLDDKRGIRSIYRMIAAGKQPTTPTFRATTSSRRIRTTTTPLSGLLPSASDNAADAQRSCSLFSRHTIQAIASISFDKPDRAFFTVDNYLYRLEQDGNYAPRFINDVLLNAPVTYQGGRITSMLALTSDDVYIALYIFQKNLYWRYNVYQTIEDVHPLLLGNTSNLDDFIIAAPPGFPKRISDGFRGINVSNPVVFQLASDDLVYFLTATEYWTWSVYQPPGQNSTPHAYEEHPVLRNLPVKPPLLQAAVLCDGKNYFFASNGSYWTWLPAGTKFASLQASRFNDYYDYHPDGINSTQMLQKAVQITGEAGRWNLPALNTSRWFLQCR